MQAFEKYIDEIKRLCLEHKVHKLYVFGSILTEAFSEASDIDLIVDFEPIDLLLYVDNYYDLKYSLKDVLQRPVDLLEEKAIKNPYFQQVVNNKKQLVYKH
jgi:predicted nucleotidyltransferase